MTKLKEGGRRCLTFAQKIKVTDWLRANDTKLKQDRPCFNLLARQLSELLEMDLSGQTLGRLLDDIGLRWQPASGDGGKGKWRQLSAAVKQVETVIGAINAWCATVAERRINQLESLVEKLACRLAKLESDLGVKNVNVVQKEIFTKEKTS